MCNELNRLFLFVCRSEIYAAADNADHNTQHNIAGQAFKTDGNAGYNRIGNDMSVTYGRHGNDTKIKRIDNSPDAFAEVKSVIIAESDVQHIDRDINNREADDEVDKKIGKFA